MNVTTWNVLHRIHAVNWKEAPVLAFPDERVRIAGITALIARWLESGETDVVCLQEVSGDQLASLQAALAPAGVQIFDHLYPRVPRLRGASEGGPPVLDDPNEHLVTLVVKTSPARRVDSHTFDSDPGKGFLVVDVGDIRVIDTHVSFGPRMAAQLTAIAAAAPPTGGPVMVLGDFNALSTMVRVGLGEHFVITELTGQRHTRIPTSDKPGWTIDHVVVRGGAIDGATVLEHGALSDHSPVRAAVRLPDR